MTGKIAYKKRFLSRLETALKMERKKYAATPITPDLIPEYEVAQGWGYVVAGYFLIEQGFKAILYARGVQPRKTHAQSVLFAELPGGDRDVLCAYYDDFRHSFPSMSSFPFSTLNEFLANLDGPQESSKGSLVWRYFPIEGEILSPMPIVGIDVMHELVHGCVCLIRAIVRNEDTESALRHTYSWRCQRKRWKRQRDWLTVRMNSPEWGKEGDRLEILSGPAYGERYDYLVFEGKRFRHFFAPLPDAEKVGLPILDKRDELESFDPVKGFQSIGVVMNSPTM